MLNFALAVANMVGAPHGRVIVGPPSFRLEITLIVDGGKLPQNELLRTTTSLGAIRGITCAGSLDFKLPDTFWKKS